MDCGFSKLQWPHSGRWYCKSDKQSPDEHRSCYTMPSFKQENRTHAGKSAIALFLSVLICNYLFFLYPHVFPLIKTALAVINKENILRHVTFLLLSLMNIHLVCQAFNRNEKSDNTDGGKCFRKMRNSPWIKQCDVCQIAITGNLNTRNTQWNLNVIKIWEIDTHFLIYLILYQLSHKRKQNLTLHVSKSISFHFQIPYLDLIKI